MTIIRIANRNSDKFVMISRRSIQDKRLSWEARGLLAYLLSKPNDWTVIVESLVNESPNARRDRVYRILNELEELGYCVKRNLRDGNRFVGVERTIHETPVSGFSVSEVSVSVTSVSEKSDTTGERDNKREKEQDKYSLANEVANDNGMPKAFEDSPFKDKALFLCELLAQLITDNGNRCGKITKKWKVDMDLVMRIDERNPHEVEQVLRWSQANAFWCGNILSPQKFRAKYDTLRTQMRNEGLTKPSKRVDPLARFREEEQ